METLESLDSTKTDLSDRDFEDILAACRPRNHGEYMNALPSTLLAILKLFSHESSQYQSVRFNETNDMKADRHQRDISILPPSLNMNDVILSSRGFKFHRSHDIDTLSSSFNSTFSFLRDCKPMNQFISSPLLEAIQIQQLSTFGIPSLHLDAAPSRNIARSKSDESLSTLGEDVVSEDLHTIAKQWKERMSQYDMGVYSKASRGDIASSHGDAKAMSVKKYVIFHFLLSRKISICSSSNTITGRSANKILQVALAQH